MSLLDRVRNTIAEHALVARGDMVVVGVSGGPDSLALLHVLAGLRSQLEIAVHVAHLNHQLRGADSDADAEFVTQVARDWDLPVTVEARDVAALAREQRRSLEEAARNARYAFLAEVAVRTRAPVIAVAHNADDQVETVLMHFLRGAGLAGLRGMTYRVSLLPGGLPIPDEYPAAFYLVRPLLDIPRRDIEAYCSENGLTPRVDASNADATFFRNRLRHEALPYLGTLNPNIRDILRRTARVIADDYAYLQHQVDDAYIRLMERRRDETITLDLHEWRELPVALQRGTLREAVRALKSDLRDLNWEHVEAAREIALYKRTGAMATLPGGLALVVGYKRLSIGPAGQLRQRAAEPGEPQLSVDSLPVAVPGTTHLPDSDWLFMAEYTEERQRLHWWPDHTALLDAAALQGQVVLRRRRPGDRFQPSGLGGHSKSVQEFMIEAKIPRVERNRLPLLAVGDRVVWIPGRRVDEGVRVTGKTREVVKVGFRLEQDAFL